MTISPIAPGAERMTDVRISIGELTNLTDNPAQGPIEKWSNFFWSSKLALDSHSPFHTLPNPG
jgi:hypothetical protein